MDMVCKVDGIGEVEVCDRCEVYAESADHVSAVHAYASDLHGPRRYVIVSNAAGEGEIGGIPDLSALTDAIGEKVKELYERIMALDDHRVLGR
ncbi:hypothetical protein [Desulfogranum mediterraneum]|uniref:hypothetical protein n=1 Tax=Desulfogranum mediterraneum TaxID=160661 RepID=UPI00048B86C7|nr:hypothetical protein [Desulfogranum mediterraneum]